MEVDEALEKVGGYRRWHMVIFTCLGFSVFMPLCWQGLSIVFIGYSLDHRCVLEQGLAPNETIPEEYDYNTRKMRLSHCKMYVNSSKETNQTMNCPNGWWYDVSQGDWTIVSEWDLVCSRDILSEISQAIYQVGCLVGEIVGSWLVDRLGRKYTHIAAHACIVGLGVGVAFSNNFILFIVLRSLMGFFIVLSLLSGLTMMMEVFDSKRRTFAGIGVEFQWVAVYMLLPLIGYFVRDWRIFQIIITVGSVVWIIYHWILPESPVWLAARGRYEEAESGLAQMAKFNGISSQVGDIRLKREADILLTKIKRRQSEIERRHFTVPMEVKTIDMVADPKLRRHTAISMLLWFANNIVYYGLILSTPSLAGDRFINFALMGIVEIPCFVLALFVVSHIGRRLPLMVFHILAGVPLAALSFTPRETAGGTDLTILQSALALTAKFGISSSFAVIVLYTRELFPTNLRGTAGGVCNVFGRVGNMVAPMAAYAQRTPLAWLPGVCFAVVSIFAGFMTLFLPETKQKPLPQTLGDVYLLYADVPKLRKTLAEKGDIGDVDL